MKDKELEEYLEKNYFFLPESDDKSKYQNMLMAVRRAAFVDGAKFIMDIIKPVI